MDDDLGLLVAMFRKSLAARNRSRKTISAYVGTVEIFNDWALANDHPTDPAKVRRGDVEEFIVDQLERWTASTAASRFRCLQQWFKWLVEEKVIDRSPMVNMSPPTLGETPVPVLSTDELAAMIAAADGPAFEGRRDAAIVRMFTDTGVRLGEMASMRVDRLDFDAQEVVVVGKGNRGRVVPFGDKTALALGRYLRERAKHRLADADALWLGIRGPLTESGITQRLRKIADKAGVADFHPHRYRHTFAHRWLAAGGNEGDLQTLAGWRSPQMLARYGASAKAERARDAHRRLRLGDDL